MLRKADFQAAADGYTERDSMALNMLIGRERPTKKTGKMDEDPHRRMLGIQEGLTCNYRLDRRSAIT